MALDSVTEEIKRRADLTEIVGQYVALRPAGNDRFKACCPFHDEKTPSFYVSRDKGFYKCFGCGASGSVFDFLMKIENLTFPDAKKLLAARYGIKIPERRELSDEQKAEVSERERLMKIATSAQRFFQEQFAGNNGLLARDYARQRGLSRETVEKFGLGYAPDAWDGLRSDLTRKHGFSDDDGISAGLFIEKKSLEGEIGGLFAEGAKRRVYDRYRHRLMFPIWDESGRVIAFGGRALDGGQFGTPDAKYINSPETPLFHKSNVLFAWHLARGEVSKRGGVIVTEGYMDAIALHEGDFPHTVATLGTALTAHHVSMLKRMAPQSVWMCFDGDSAGMKAALRTAPLFSDADLNVRVVRFPSEHDPDTFIREFGRDGMQNALDEAIPLAKYRLETVVSSKNFEDLHQRGEAMREAAEIINDISDGIEREGYVNFLVDVLLGAQGSGNRSDWERNRPKMEALVQAELSADARKQGAQQRFRESKFGTPKAPSNDAPIPFQQLANEAQIGTAPVVVENQTFRPKWQPSPRQLQKQEEEAKEASDLRESTQKIMARAGSGVLKAEKALIGALLESPVWRAHILEKLPLGKWTDETHGEIVIRVRNWGQNEGEDEQIDPSRFNEELSRAAQSVVAEVMLADGAGAPLEGNVVNDWIKRVEKHWAQQTEREMLELVRGKIERGETLSESEREGLNVALVANKRKMPVEAK